MKDKNVHSFNWCGVIKFTFMVININIFRLIKIIAFLCSFQNLQNDTDFSTMQIVDLLTKKGYTNILLFEKTFSNQSDL